MTSRAFIIPISFIFIAAGLAPAATSHAAIPITYYRGSEVRADAVSVTFRPGTSISDMEEAAGSVHGEIARISDGRGIRHSLSQWEAALSDDPETAHVYPRARIVLDGTSIDEALDVLSEIPYVDHATAIHLYRPLFEPDDPYYDEYQGNFRQVFVPQAWDLADGSGVMVAVVDTGYRALDTVDRPAVIIPGWDFGDEDADVTDHNGHGTHISNTIVEETDNGVGAAGIAYNALLLPLKVFPGEDDTASSDDIADAIDYAVQMGADVINLSLGGEDDDPDMGAAVERAFERNVVLAAASGNDAKPILLYPAAYADTIAVGSVTPHDPGAAGARSDFSNWGEGLDLLAPGERIFQESWSEDHGVAYYVATGTSASTPHVSATAALMISRAGRVNAEDARETLRSTARDMGQPGWDEETGFGELDAEAAVLGYAPGSGPIKPIAIIDYEIRGTAAPRRLFLDSSASYDPDGDIKRVLWVLPGGMTSDARTESIEAQGKVSLALIVYDDEGRSGTLAAAIDPYHDTNGRFGGGGDSGWPPLCGLQRANDAACLLVALAGLAVIRVCRCRSGPRRSPSNRSARRRSA